MIAKARDPDFDLKQLRIWVAGIIQAFGLKKDKERRSLDGFNPDLLSYVRLGSSPFTRPKGIFEAPSILGQNRKRPARNSPKGEPKRFIKIVDHEDMGEEGLRNNSFPSRIVEPSRERPKTTLKIEERGKIYLLIQMRTLLQRRICKGNGH